MKRSHRCAAGGKAQEVRCVIHEPAPNPSVTLSIVVTFVSVKSESSLPAVALGDVTILAMAAAGLCRRAAKKRARGQRSRSAVDVRRFSSTERTAAAQAAAAAAGSRDGFVA